MPAPTSYTEVTLAEFALIELGPTADVLSWTAGSPPVAEVVADVAAALGLADVATSTNTAALRALARRYAWRRARSALASRYAHTEDGQSFHPEQMFAHATEMLADAERECAALGVGGVGSVVVTGVTWSQDPYGIAGFW